ncbi:MAG: sulfite exporter TauE/SafE family protein [Spirochaetia bacterium]|jgi:sulfite exporter TauE/SafE/copper chaperone CopZ
MAGKRATARLTVDGMTCSNCEQRIEKAVRALPGIGRVSASAPISEVIAYYDPELVTRGAILDAIRGAGYQVREDSIPAARSTAAAQDSAAAKSRSGAVYRFLGLIAVVAAIYLIIRYTVGFTFLPTVTQSMGYGLIFVVGLLTSLHCIAMCGGIVLSQGIKRNEDEGTQDAHATPTSTPIGLNERLLPSLLYNGGRVVSYTIIGGIVGALGSLFSLSTTLKGAMPVIAGAFMLFLGLRMLGIFPWLSRLRVRFPGLGGSRMRSAASGRGPFVVGLLNGLMPCGPLQTMQVYALGTGSFLAGALSMFLFSLGTVPLLLGFGAISAFLSAKFNRRMLKASGILVMALGLVMFTRGMSLFGVALPVLTPGSGGSIAVAKVVGDYQEVRTTVDSGEYHPFIVQKGIPLRWTVSAKAEDLNGCNNPLTVPQYGIRKQLLPGDNLIEFTPDRDGTISYTCWMGMISSSIRIVPDLKVLTASDLSAPTGGSIASAFGSGGGGGGCCGATPGKFANGKIPVDVIQIAKRTVDGQVADVVVDANGYSPAVIVMKRGVKGKVRFVAGNLSSCNSVVNFPEYQGGLDLSQGQLETPLLEITSDFTFECGMGMLHGYVKVVDDTDNVDLNAVRAQVASFKPRPGAGGCCGR